MDSDRVSDMRRGKPFFIVAGLLLTGSLYTHPTMAGTDDLLIEEVQVTAFNGCGPWPIRHRLISICSYAQLKVEKMEAVRQLREQVQADCLDCKAGVCRPLRGSAASADRGRLCRKLFWTPIRVGVIRAHVMSRQDLVVDFSYAISTRGRVTDIEISYLESELDHRTVLALIREGAAQIEFEPVALGGDAIKIADLEHGFTLQER